MQFVYLNKQNFEKTLGKLADRAEDLYTNFKNEELEELLKLELESMQSKCTMLNNMYTEIVNYNLRQSIALGDFNDE